MVSLPASIETYLQEAGFSSTELLILKKLLEGDAVTLRELAAKTGKSTGVLAQATKKLIDRKIITREHINDTDKYLIGSLDAIQAWVDRDMQQQHEVLHRKKLDFDAFLSTVKHEKGRPEMEFFEGLEGIKKAFAKLLEREETEWLQFAPTIMREEDDPVNDFRVQVFRERRKRQIFARSIVPDVPLGRRYKSADAYQYRQTRLVPADDFPVTFEKVIVGNTVACIDLVEQKASFINFPELADGQRKLFNILWRGAKEEGEVEVVPEEPDIPWRTRLGSALREFFLGKKHALLIVICAAIALTVSVVSYQHNKHLNTQRIRERVIAIAATAAPDFDYSMIAKINSWEDASRPEYSIIVKQLQNIRTRNPEIEYAYIMRSTDDEHFYAFVADADSIDLSDKTDLNEDGLINDMIHPGQLWHEYDPDSSAIHLGMREPSADESPTYDEWGIWIAGHAPIKNSNGDTIAILGVDMEASKVDKLTKMSFSFSKTFFTILALLLAVSFLAFNKNYTKN